MPVPPQQFFQLIEELIPFNKFLGVKIGLLEEGRVRLELPFRPEFIGDPMRPALHGGVISMLADTAGGMAVWTRISLDDRVSTIDLRIDYLAPGAADKLIAEATVVRVGNRVGVTDIRCYQPNDPERTVATGKGVYNIKRSDD